MCDVSTNQMVDEIIEAVDNARNRECPHQVRKGVIDSLYWINAYQLIDRYKDDLISNGVVDGYIDFGWDWVGEVIAFERMLKRHQRNVVKVANSAIYGTHVVNNTIGGESYVDVGNIGLGDNTNWGSTNVSNKGIVWGHRINDNGVLEVKTADGWVAVESNTISTGYRGQDDDQDVNSIGSDLVGVQQMNGPSGSIRSLRFKRNESVGDHNAADDGVVQVKTVNGRVEANVITTNGGVGSHRVNDNGVLQVKTADGWVDVVYRGQDGDDQDLNSYCWL